MSEGPDYRTRGQLALTMAAMGWHLVETICEQLEQGMVPTPEQVATMRDALVQWKHFQLEMEVN